MIQTIVTAFIAFASTNIDDIFILMTLFTQVPRPLEKRSIIAGQYLGIITLVLISIGCSLIGMVVPAKYIGLLGLFPVYLGLTKIFRYQKDDHDEKEDEIKVSDDNRGLLPGFIGGQAFSIAAITIANGGDNIGIYVPLFARASLSQIGWTVLVFLVLVYVWLISAEYATNHPLLKEKLKRYNHILFPAILIGLGVYIIVDSRTYELIM
jgi:cadmium resistance transport/sequestration family protein